MPEDIQPLGPADWPDEYAVDFDELERAESEEPFLRVSFELLKEAAGLTTLVAGLLDEANGHDRNQAILVGHLVRMVKMMRTMIRAIADDHGGDQQMQLVRQFLDSASALDYLLENISDTTRFDAYVHDGLIAEREFLANVKDQIAKRGGTRLPIEERIERSIEQTFTAACVRPEDVPGRKTNGWPSAQTRLNQLSPTAYSAYRAGSTGIHGAWHDLERNHLDYIEGKYYPRTEAARLRPQPLFVLALLSVHLAQIYVKQRFPFASATFEPRFAAFLTKVQRADVLHEQLLTKQMEDAG